MNAKHLRLAQIECADCSCCTARLCEKGRAHPFECEGFANAEAKALVRGCPCSADTTPGTASHAAALLRAERHAVERPLAGTVEFLLRSVAAGAAEDFSRNALTLLQTWRYVTTDGASLLVTEAGRKYLAARDVTT